MPMTKQVEMIDEDGFVITTYPSMSAAAEDNYMTRHNVWYRCSGRMKEPFKYYDFTFRFKE